MTFQKKYTKFNKKHGEDYSEVYVQNKRCFLYIGRVCPEDTDKIDTIMFKPFIKGFEISVDAKYKKPAKAKPNPNALESYDGVTMSYIISISVPAVSMAEARNNAKKISRFMNMLTPDKIGSDFASISFYVSMSNLIQSGKWRSAHDINGPSSLKRYGLFCEIYDVSSDVDVELGFFEEGGALWPKAHTLSFKLNPQEMLDDNSSLYHIRGLDKRGGYAKLLDKEKKRVDIDVKTWPFGVW